MKSLIEMIVVLLVLLLLSFTAQEHPKLLEVAQKLLMSWFGLELHSLIMVGQMVLLTFQRIGPDLIGLELARQQVVLDLLFL